MDGLFKYIGNRAWLAGALSYWGHLETVRFGARACADPRIFVRRGGGGPGQSDKKSSDNVFLYFFSPNLILQKSNGQFQRNLSFFKVPEGVQHFSGGPTFSRGVQLFPGGGGYNCLFPIETLIACDFPGVGGGGVQTPCPPSGSALDVHKRK